MLVEIIGIKVKAGKPQHLKVGKSYLINKRDAEVIVANGQGVLAENYKPQTEPEIDLSKLPKKELIDYAEKQGIEVDSKLTKAQIIDLI